MSNDTGVPTADDFTPVLVYVIINVIISLYQYSDKHISLFLCLGESAIVAIHNPIRELLLREPIMRGGAVLVDAVLRVGGVHQDNGIL